MRFSLAKLLRRETPKTPPGGVVAGSSVGTMLAPYIGELPLDPRASARYAHTVLEDQTRALETYRNVLRDDRCRAALDQRLDAAIAKPWEVEPGGDGAIDQAAAESLEAQLKGVSFDAVCRQLLHGVWYGWSVAEAIWERGDAEVMLEDLRVRSADRFTWDAGGGLLLRTYARPQGEPVPEAKFVVLARPGEHGDLPFSPGLARWCYWLVWLKRHGLKFWAIALEKFGAPTAKGVYRRGALPEEKADLLDLVQSLATGSGVVHPEDQVIELLATAQRTGGSGGLDFQGFIEYLDRAITTVILGQSSTTDQGPWRGTAEVQKDVRDETVASDCRLLDAALNSTVARWLTEWNFPGAETPVIRHDADPQEDLDARAKREEVVSRTAGLRPTERHVLDVYGGEWEEAPRPTPAPAPAEEEEGGEDEETPPDEMAAARGAALVRALAEAGAGGDAIDGAVDELLRGEGWETLIGPAVEPVLAEAAAALERGESIDDWRDRLPDLFSRMDDAAVVETLRRMTFSAHLSGDAGLGGDNPNAS